MSIKKTNVWQQDKEHFLHPYTDFSSFEQTGSQIISHASGNYVGDQNGQQYLDAIAGLWCVNIGHGREEMADAIGQQVKNMQYYNPFGHCSNEPAAELAAKLAALSPGSLNHVYYTCGGSTANESAIRIIHYYNNMRGKPNKKKIISRNDAYHGSTYVTANLTGINATKIGFDRICDDWISHVSAASMYRRPKGAEHLSEADFCDFLVNEFENHIANLGADNVAAFIAEPIAGAGGVLVAPKDYHKRICDLCKANDILYIADEVVTAFGRLGEWNVSQSIYGYEPDVIIYAKGINSGYVPLGAAVFSEQIYQVISKPQCDGGLFSMGFTYTGHAVACAAALKNIEIIEAENILQHVRELSPTFFQLASKLLQSPIVGDVRGAGYMLGIELVADKATKQSFDLSLGITNRIYEKCLEKGVIVRPVGHCIILSPPLTFGPEEIELTINTLAASIDEVANSL